MRVGILCLQEEVGGLSADNPASLPLLVRTHPCQGKGAEEEPPEEAYATQDETLWAQDH